VSAQMAATSPGMKGDLWEATMSFPAFKEKGRGMSSLVLVTQETEVAPGDSHTTLREMKERKNLGGT